MVTEYVVGFLMDDNVYEVALITKNRPEWQADHLNGIGGHVEEGELPFDAMQREFHEETGLLLAGWSKFLVVDYPEARIHFYRLFVPSKILHSVETKTDEEVSVYPLHMANTGWYDIVPNLQWILPLASYVADDYDVIRVNLAENYSGIH